VEIDENLPEGMRNLILDVSSPINQPFSRELWQADSAALLSQVTAPVLILIGKKDLQVDWQSDGSVFEAMVADHPNVTLSYPENANHVLKYEPKPRAELNPAEVATRYNADDVDLDPQTIEAITSWLEARR
jgi:alpha-beta hydrolase superfamily lysophospholipase